MNLPGKLGKSHARVFVVQIRPPGKKEPLLYPECLPAEAARQLARSLSMQGVPATVRVFRISAAEVEKLSAAGGRRLCTVRVLPQSA